MFNTSKAWAVGLLAAVFAAGVGAGAAVQALAGDDSPPRRGRRNVEATVAHLTHELELSEPQQDSIRAVLERYRPTFDSAWQQMRPRYDSLRQRVRAEIGTHLTPDQRSRYERLVASLEHQHRRNRDRNH